MVRCPNCSAEHEYHGNHYCDSCAETFKRWGMTDTLTTEPASVRCPRCRARESGLGRKANPHRPVRFTCTHPVVFTAKSPRRHARDQHAEWMRVLVTRESLASLENHFYRRYELAVDHFPEQGSILGDMIRFKRPPLFTAPSLRDAARGSQANDMTS